MNSQESTLVVSAHAADPAARRGTQLRRNAGPNLGLPQSTLAEAYMRVFPQVTDRLA